jgi:histidyl-tRNA synthetase
LTDGVSQLGSIAAGGRYDNLVGMFSSSGQQTPCVGVSIGVERVFTILEKKANESSAAAHHSDIQVYVASIGSGYVPERMRVAKLLWQNNVPAEYSHLENPKFKKQLDEALERYIPVMVVFGEDELNRRVVKVKNMREHTEVEVEYSEQSLLAAVMSAGAKQTMANADFGLLDLMK